MLYSFHSVRMRKLAIKIGRYVLHIATICFERNMLINQRICNKNEIQALNDGCGIHFTCKTEFSLHFDIKNPAVLLME